VTPDYKGLITIVGLSYKAQIKIVSASGKMVNEGQSNGGTYTWNGCDRNGNRVASGVYHVLVSNSDGSDGSVCRIAVIK
jgi:flagellar hook assembly protein FlgD